ncbi:MAG: hypothetical protein P8X62_08735 [Flavobacteriaceae bacterium]
MDVIHQKYILKAKVFLVFFCLVQFYNCKNKDEISDVKIVYENEKAVAVYFATNLDENNIKIYLKGNKETSVLGETVKENGIITFIPIVPFSNGKTYEIQLEILFQKIY